MSDATFLDLVDQLTKPHPVTLQRDAGTTIHTMDGLLQQLREAVFGGMEGGSGSQFGSKLPIDPAAEDLLNEIDVQAAEALARIDRRPTPFGHTESYVRLWAGQVDEDAVMIVSSKESLEFDPADPLKPVVIRVLHEYTALQLVRRWVARIEDFFNPAKAREIQAPCPSCGTRYVYRQKDGATAQSAALVFVLDKETGDSIEARCQADHCGVSWPPDKFLYLAELIGATIKQEAERHADTEAIAQSVQT